MRNRTHQTKESMACREIIGSIHHRRRRSLLSGIYSKLLVAKETLKKTQYCVSCWVCTVHDDVIKFSALLALCAGEFPANSPHKCQWRGALVFSLICAWINAWINNRKTGDLRRHHARDDVIVMLRLGRLQTQWSLILGPAFRHL